MTSPSSTNSSRNTPCVDGCCGPMLTVSSSRFSRSANVPPNWVPRPDMSSKGVPAGVVRSVAAIRLARDGEVDGLRAERLGAAQRVAAPVVGQHDPPQVGVILKLDAKQVEQLAFVPVCAGHERG